VIGSTHGCSDEQPVEDFCGFMANTGNCYSEFHEDLGAACGSADAALVQGSFGSRAALDICVLSSGGQVVFDPPIDLTKKFPTGALQSVKLMTQTGTECGSVAYTSQYSFVFTVNPLPGADAGTDGGGTGGQGGAEEAAEPHWKSGTIASSALPGRDTVDVSCSAPDVVSATQVAGAESHHFNLNQVIQGDKNCGCSQYSQIIPQAILEFNAGGVNTAGSVRLRIHYPPRDPAVVDDGADAPKTSSQQTCETMVPAVQPDVVYYFDCGFPGAARACENGLKDNAETDVDCGGPQSSPGCPASCADGQFCATDCDCASGTACTVDMMSGIRKCTAGAIPVLTNCPGIICANKKKDSSESDVDCGGGCPGCAVDKACNTNDDCLSKTCTDGKCTKATCTDTAKNGTESDVDCGGGDCPTCAIGKLCLMPTDCASGVCGVSGGTNVCTTCPDMAKNGTETDVDCGGALCPKCADKKDCLVNSDCLSNACAAGTCVSCTDMLKNGTETDIDCGGACSQCAGGKKCSLPSDCASNSCVGGVCLGCDDLKQNGAETDVDCGGGTCPSCNDGKVCAMASDCLSGACSSFKCISCNDTLKNGTETDVDCGGACPKCADLKQCNTGSDCLNAICTNGFCISCPNGMKDGAETDLDCGGGTCPKCAEAKGCKANTDCFSGICIGNMCQATCSDAIQDGSETDVDCGGGTCSKCANNKACTQNSDCASGNCTANVCQP
jgi:hypothetical protein